MSALGATVAFALGYPPTGAAGFGYALAFTALGAALLTASRSLVRHISQEAFARLHQRWGRISRYERPDAWVRRVAINLAMSHAKREGRRRERETRAERLSGRAPTDTTTDDEVMSAIRTLPARDQALVVLFYFEDRPVDEAADILQITPGAAKVALHRARARLATVLHEEVRDER